MSIFQHSNPVNRIYRAVIDEVCNNAREGFLDEGLDEQVLLEFKNVWENKVLATKAIDSFSDNLTAGPLRGSFVTQMPVSGHGMTIPVVSPLQLANPQLPPGIALPPALMSRSFVLQSLSGGTVRYLHNVNSEQSTAAAAAAAAATAAVAGRSFMAKIVPAPVSTNSAPVSGRSDSNQLDGSSSTAERSSSNVNRIYQVDGPAGLSDAEDAVVEDEDDDSEDFNEGQDENDDGSAGRVEDADPLNSDDDVSFDDETEMFEADNVAACQYEKVNRTRNKWKFVFKDGIMNINGKDYVFNRAAGEAEF